jgi:hypothetical protein
MIKVLVKYEMTQDSGHALLDDYKIVKSKIVELEKLTELNNMFPNIIKVEIIESDNRDLLIEFFKHFRDNGEKNIGMTIEQFVDDFLTRSTGCL